MLSEKCCWQDCKNTPSHSIYPDSFCIIHYEQSLKENFVNLYNRWDGTIFSDDELFKLKKGFSRYIEFIYDRDGWPVYLTRTRIRDRTYDFLKTSYGLIFSIERHYNAWSAPNKMERYEHIYQYTIADNRVELVHEYPNNWLNKLAHLISWAIINKQEHWLILVKKFRKWGKVFVVDFSQLGKALLT